MSEPDRDSQAVAEYLETEDAHQSWISHYRGPENELFYQLALDYAARTMKLEPGDTIHDFEVAEELGVKCILIADGHQSKRRLIKTGAKVIDNLSQLLLGNVFEE